MKRIGLIIILLSILTSCQKKQLKDRYLVTGVAQNIPDSTKILMYFSKDSILDSTFVFKEQFQFKGKVDRPRRVMLRMERTKDSKMFWLENNQVTISGKKGDFSNSKIVGSKTQKEAEILVKRKDSIFKEMTKLNEIVNDNNQDSLFVVYEQMIDVEASINKNFIMDYPKSYESLTVLHGGTMKRLGPVETGELFALLSEELQATEEGVSIVDFIKLKEIAKVGEEYIDFAQRNAEGQLVRFSELKGKITLLEFWASWCGPCRAFNPELLELYGKYKNKGFEIVGVSLDVNKKKWVQAIEKDGLIWENISDLKGGANEAALIYGVTDIPENFLIDEKGTIIARYLRGDKLKSQLKMLFED